MTQRRLAQRQIAKHEAQQDLDGEVEGLRLLASGVLYRCALDVVIQNPSHRASAVLFVCSPFFTVWAERCGYEGQEVERLRRNFLERWRQALPAEPRSQPAQNCAG